MVRMERENWMKRSTVHARMLLAEFQEKDLDLHGTLSYKTTSESGTKHKYCT